MKIGGKKNEPQDNFLRLFCMFKKVLKAKD